MTTKEELGRFAQIGREIGDLVEEKNAAYGNSFGKVADFLKILWPNGIPVESYTDALCTVRMFDKLMRIANKKDAFGESPYRDIAGYAILGVEKDEHVQKGTEVKATEDVDVVDPSKLFFNDEAIKNFKVLDQKAINRWQELAGITKKGIINNPDLIEDLKLFHSDITQEDIDNINKYGNETFGSRPLGEDDLKTLDLVKKSKKLVQELMNGEIGEIIQKQVKEEQDKIDYVGSVNNIVDEIAKKGEQEIRHNIDPESFKWLREHTKVPELALKKDFPTGKMYYSLPVYKELLIDVDFADTHNKRWYYQLFEFLANSFSVESNPNLLHNTAVSPHKAYIKSKSEPSLIGPCSLEFNFKEQDILCRLPTRTIILNKYTILNYESIKIEKELRFNSKEEAANWLEIKSGSDVTPNEVLDHIQNIMNSEVSNDDKEDQAVCMDHD